LERKAERFSGVRERYFGLFSCSGFSEGLRDMAKSRGDILLFSDITCNIRRHIAS